MTTDETKQFLTAKIAEITPVIEQLKIMQIAWRAGGDLFKDRLEVATKELGSWLAVRDEFQRQLDQLPNSDCQHAA